VAGPVTPLGQLEADAIAFESPQNSTVPGYQPAYVAMLDSGSVVPVIAPRWPPPPPPAPRVRICVSAPPRACPTASTGPAAVAFWSTNAWAYVADKGAGVVAESNTKTHIVPLGWCIRVGVAPDDLTFVP